MEALLKAGHDSKAIYDNSVQVNLGSNPAVRDNLFIMKIHPTVFQ